MDKDCISAIIKFIKLSDMANLGIKLVENRPIRYNAEKDEDEGYTVGINASDIIFSNKPSLSESWIVGNLLFLLYLMGIWEINANLLKELLSGNIIIICQKVLIWR